MGYITPVKFRTFSKLNLEQSISPFKNKTKNYKKPVEKESSGFLFKEAKGNESLPNFSLKNSKQHSVVNFKHCLKHI